MSSTFKKKLLNSIYFVIGILFVIVLYQLFAFYKQENAFNKNAMKLLLPNIDKIFKAFFKSLIKPKVWLSILNTLWHLFISILIASIIGITLGVVSGLKSGVRWFLKPLMSLLRSIPVVIFVIILLLALTNDSNVPIVATILILIPIFYQASLEGVISIDKDQIDSYKLYSNFNFKVLIKFYIPSIIGFIRQAFVTSISFGIKVVISTEYLSIGKNNIGRLIFNARYFLEYDYVYAYVLLILLISIFIELIPYLISKYYYRNENE